MIDTNRDGKMNRYYKVQFLKTEIIISYNSKYDSNTDGSFTMADANSFFESLEISSDSLRQDNISGYFKDIILFYQKEYVVCTHCNRLDEAIQITLNHYFIEDQKENSFAF